MSLAQFYGTGRFGLTIEIFPPKTPEGDVGLRETLQTLAKFSPQAISCTYGAGGSTRDRTLEWCVEIQQAFKTTAISHLTCVGHTQDELLQWLQKAREQGICNTMALRGDPPQGQTSFQAVSGGLKYGAELVALIRKHFPDQGIGVGGYPEKHPEASSLAVDIQHLKQKVDAGADAIFTQLFYVNQHFLKFRELAQQAGITIPVIPGIMPITEFARIKRITAMCGTEIPNQLASQLEQAQHDKQAQFEIGVAFAIEQCRELIREGIPGIHFYALNKSHACEIILRELGLGTT